MRMSEVPQRGILASAPTHCFAVDAPLLIAEVTLRNFRLQKRTFELHLLKPFAHPHPDSQNANPKGVRILAILFIIAPFGAIIILICRNNCTLVRLFLIYLKDTYPHFSFCPVFFIFPHLPLCQEYLMDLLSYPSFLC